MATRTILPLITLLFLACGGGTPHDAREEALHSKAMEADGRAYDMAGGTPEAPVPLPAERKIIRSGNLSFEVDDLDAARTTIVQRVHQVGGYVEGDDRNDWGGGQNLTVRVRIPADGFDAFVEGMGSLGRLEHRSINAVDVTTEWVDVEARLGAKRTLEKRYLELAGQARNVNGCWRWNVPWPLCGRDRKYGGAPEELARPSDPEQPHHHLHKARAHGAALHATLRGCPEGRLEQPAALYGMDGTPVALRDNHRRVGVVVAQAAQPAQGLRTAKPRTVPGLRIVRYGT